MSRVVTRSAAAATASALALLASAAAAQSLPPLSLHLDAVSMRRFGGTVQVRCDGRWVHASYRPIAGDTCCSGGAFDGLWLVVTDRRGRELTRRLLASEAPLVSSLERPSVV